MATRTVLFRHEGDDELAEALAGGLGEDDLLQVDTDRADLAEALADAARILVLSTSRLGAWLAEREHLVRLTAALPTAERRVELVELDAGGPPAGLPYDRRVPVRSPRTVRLRLPAGGRPGGGEEVEARYDDLVCVEHDDGMVEWLTAEDQARRGPQAGGAVVVRATVERLDLDDLVEAARGLLGDAVADRVGAELAAFASDRATAVSETLAWRLVALLEDLVAAARHRDDRVLPPCDEPGRDWLAERVTPGRLLQLVDVEDGARAVLRAGSGLPPLDPERAEVLVLVHGSLLPTEHSFGGLLAGDALRALRGRFGANILAWQHRPWSASPAESAAGLAQALRLVGATAGRHRLVLLGHEQGGLVGELLCTPAPPGAGAGAGGRDWSVHGLAPGDRAALADLHSGSGAAGLDVTRLVRVAAPVGGSSLLGGGLTPFASAVLGGPAAGSGQPVLALAFKLMLAFLRTLPAVPGLAAMAPTSPLVYWLEHAPSRSWQAARGQLFVVAGELRASLAQAQSVDLGHGVAVLVGKGGFPGRHDGVVDTDHAVGGWPRMAGASLELQHAKGGIDHGRYLDNDVTGPAILAALVSPEAAAGHFREPQPRSAPGARGALDYFGMLLEDGLERRVPLQLLPPAGTERRGTVVFVPGIMGSHLVHPDLVGPHASQLWVDLGMILAGYAAWLSWSEGDGIRAPALIDGFYGDFVRFLAGRGYRVLTFPYDWRASVHDNGALLGAELEAALAADALPVHVVAHSMGGLVTRAALGQRVGLWPRLKARGGRVLQGGTPNRGAPQLLRMLAEGEHSVLGALNAIARLTRERDLVDLRAILSRMPGVLDMLPHPEPVLPLGGVLGEAQRRWFGAAFWRDFRGGAGALPGLRPTPEDLDAAWERLQLLESYEGQEQTRLLGDDSGHFVFLAGQAPWTLTDLDLEREQWVRSRPAGGSSHGGRLFGGDGTVPYWSAGTTDLWYLAEEHDLIFTRQDRFPAMLELLETGHTAGLGRQPAQARDISGPPDEPAPAPAPLAGLPDRRALAQLLAGRDGAAATLPTPPRPLVIGVTHGSLHHARFPVVVGHHVGDDLAGAERTLDDQLNGRLDELRRSGAYPAQPRSHLFVPDPSGEHPGVLVIGLGPVGDLAPQDLGDTLRDAFVQFAVLRNETPCGLSCLLVGADSGLPLQDVVAQLVRAAIEANDRLVKRGVGGGVPRLVDNEELFLNEIEIVEQFEDRAVAARAALDQLSEASFGAGGESCRLQVERYVRTVPGGLPNHALANLRSTNPHRLRIATDARSGHLVFELMGSRARAEQQRHLADWHTIADLIEAARSSTRDARLADRSVGHVLLHEAVPQPLRERLKVNLPLQLVLDPQAAGVPWELLRNDSEGRPPSTRFVLTRQLALATYRPQPSDAYQDKVLILADLEEEARLPGAAREGRELAERFASEGWQVEAVIGPHHDATEVRARLTPPMGRALHIAAHGVLVPHPARDRTVSAIALPGGREPGTLRPRRALTAYDLAQFDPLPQVVFLNTCHSGRMAGQQVQGHAPEFAPDMATALIGAGVRGVVVTGWEVDDRAAGLFGATFWERMLAGATLGEAALEARARTWRAHPELDTFGAYQVYGDATFRLRDPELIQRPIASRREVNDLVSRVIRDGQRSDEERARHLLTIEAQLAEAWRDDADLAFTLGQAWASVDAGWARLRGLGWLQHALTRDDGFSGLAAELMLQTWIDILWQGHGSAGARPTDKVLAVGRDLVAQRDTLRPEPGQLEADDPVACFLGLGDGADHRARFGPATGLWSFGRCQALVQSLADLVPTPRRLELLAKAEVMRALFGDQPDTVHGSLDRASRLLRQATGRGGERAFYPRVLRLGVDLFLDPDRATAQLAEERPDIAREAGEAPRNYWSRVVALDLDFIARLGQWWRDRQASRAARVADAPAPAATLQLDGLVARYDDLKRRHAPDPATRASTTWVLRVLLALPPLLKRLQDALGERGGDLGPLELDPALISFGEPEEYGGGGPLELDGLDMFMDAVDRIQASPVEQRRMGRGNMLPADGERGKR